jgi:hypothetical protein
MRPLKFENVGHWRTGNLWRLLPYNPDPDPVRLRRGAVKPGGTVVVVVEVRVPTTTQSVSPSVEPARFHWRLTPRTMRVASVVKFENWRLVRYLDGADSHTGWRAQWE